MNNSMSDDEDVDCHYHHAVTDPLLNKRDCSVDNGNDDDDDHDNDNDDDMENKAVSLRIKCSSYNKDVSIRVRPSDTIARVKEKVLHRLHIINNKDNKDNDVYVRLIAKGRLLAPDATKMREFLTTNTNTNSNNNNNNTRLVLRQDDVVHAVLAPRQQGGAEGPQAVLQRTNLNTTTNNNTNNNTTLRGAGINASGLAVPSRPGEFDDEDDESTVNEEEEEQEQVAVDLERGQAAASTTTTTTTTSRQTTTTSSSSRRRGFDRLRNAGLRRSEVSAVRAYFGRHVDRFVRQHADFALAIEQQQQTVSSSIAQSSSSSSSSASDAAASDADSDAIRRRRWLQEEAWMLAQGPTSEFRINLSTVNVFAELHNNNNPWTGINNNTASAGSGSAAAAAAASSTLQARSSAAAIQQQFRQRTTNINNAATIASSSTSSTSSEALWRAGGISAQVGTDKDFMWGFCLGFFVGFFMLVWVWMPTVPHKQKLGILTGISFQLALNMLKGSNGIHGGGDADADYDLYNAVAIDGGGGGGGHHSHLRGGGSGGGVDQDVLLMGD